MERKFKLMYLKDTILEMIDNGKSKTEISRDLKVNINNVSSLVKEFRPDLKFTPNKGNVHYFDTIDTYSKAYIAGFIAADGALVNNGNGSIVLTITLKYEDKEVLEFIKSEIGNSHNLQEIIRPSSFNPNTNIHHIRYAISDKNITKALNKLGIHSNKSLTMSNILLNIPEQFRDAFIIGYFDGDGSVTIRDGKYPNDRGFMCRDYSLYVTIRGTKDFLKGICNHLDINETHIKQFDSIPILSFASKNNTYRLFQCYNNLQFYYKRKYDKFLSRINHPSYDKYKQAQTISSSTE